MTDDKMRAFEIFRQQRAAMLNAFYLWVQTRPGRDVIEDEIGATNGTMRIFTRLPGDNHPPVREGGDV